jgi:hypothetical protein
MLKFLKDLFKDYNLAQKELAAMGVFNFITPSGVWSYVDEEMLKRYLEQKAEYDR